jgi:hypothetical protein
MTITRTKFTHFSSAFYEDDKLVAAAGTDWAGTVSETGTSSVVERGSNVNGEYVKFADGTQMAWVDNVTATILAGADFTFSFPVSFFGEPSRSFCMDDHSSTGGRDRAHFLTVRGNGGQNVGQWCVGNNSTSSTTWRLRFLAVGRWY